MSVILATIIYAAVLVVGFYLGSIFAARRLADRAAEEISLRAMGLTFVYVHAMTGKLPCEHDLLPPGLSRTGEPHVHTDEERQETVHGIIGGGPPH